MKRSRVSPSRRLSVFRSPTGQIIGRVTFEDGQAVEGVDVQISSREDIGGQSVRFKGTDGSYLETDNILAQTGLPYSIQGLCEADMDNANGIILKKKAIMKWDWNRVSRISRLRMAVYRQRLRVMKN